MQVIKFCAGPGITANSEECPAKGFHQIDASNKDVRAYNGIKHWRCPACFQAHVIKVRENQSKS